MDDWTYPAMYMAIKLSLFAAAFFGFLFWLYQPNVIENPGVAAYQPPPGTRLVPLARKMDAPEIFQIPVPERRTFAAADSLRVASVSNKPTDAVIKKNRARVANAKPRQKAVLSYGYAQRSFAYETQRQSFREWHGNRRNSWF